MHFQEITAQNIGCHTHTEVGKTKYCLKLYPAFHNPSVMKIKYKSTLQQKLESINSVGLSIYWYLLEWGRIEWGKLVITLAVTSHSVPENTLNIRNKLGEAVCTGKSHSMGDAR